VVSYGIWQTGSQNLEEFAKENLRFAITTKAGFGYCYAPQETEYLLVLWTSVKVVEVVKAGSWRLFTTALCLLPRVNRWVRCSRPAQHLLLVASMFRRCHVLLTIPTTCNRFVHSRAGRVNNKCVDLPSLAAVRTCTHCHELDIMNINEGTSKFCMPSLATVRICTNCHELLPEMGSVCILKKMSRAEWQNIWSVDDFSEKSIETYYAMHFPVFLVWRSIHQSITTPFSNFFTTIYSCIGLTCVYMSSKKAMALTFTKFSVLLGDIKG